jgi:hypothetical protein
MNEEQQNSLIANKTLTASLKDVQIVSWQGIMQKWANWKSKENRMNFFDDE